MAPHPAAVLVLGLACLAGCGSATARPRAAPSSACASRDRAIAIARSQESGPVSVVSASCVRFGDVVHGSTLLKPDTRVWSVVLGGRFAPVGCPPPLPPRTFAPCAGDARTEQIVVDAAATRFVLGIVPGQKG
jgi:hypothetical protein